VIALTEVMEKIGLFCRHALAGQKSHTSLGYLASCQDIKHKVSKTHKRACLAAADVVVQTAAFFKVMNTGAPERSFEIRKTKMRSTIANMTPIMTIRAMATVLLNPSLLSHESTVD